MNETRIINWRAMELIKARLANRTPGNWKPLPEGKWVRSEVAKDYETGRGIVTTYRDVTDEEWAKNRLNDADFVAHAPDDIAALIAEVEQLSRWLDEKHDYPRCGDCDNVKICGVHDCPENPLYSEEQFCDECAGCKSPQDDKHGGPCGPCTCVTET